MRISSGGGGSSRRSSSSSSSSRSRGSSAPARRSSGNSEDARRANRSSSSSGRSSSSSGSSSRSSGSSSASRPKASSTSSAKKKLNRENIPASLQAWAGEMKGGRSGKSPEDARRSKSAGSKQIKSSGASSKVTIGGSGRAQTKATSAFIEGYRTGRGGKTLDPRKIDTPGTGMEYGRGWKQGKKDLKTRLMDGKIKPSPSASKGSGAYKRKG